METSSIPVIILCGGRGVFVDTSGERRNKALVPVGGLPMVANVIRMYARYGYRQFLLSVGIQSAQLATTLEQVQRRAFPTDLTWEVLDTGAEAPTWPRIAAWEARLAGVSTFAITYCDSLVDMDLAAALLAHEKNKTVLSLTAVLQPSRFRFLGLRPPDPLVRGFAEKPILRTDRINGGFYFARATLFDWVRRRQWANVNSLSLEGFILEGLVKDRQASCYMEDGEFRFLDGERDIEPLARLAGFVA